MTKVNIFYRKHKKLFWWLSGGISILYIASSVGAGFYMYDLARKKIYASNLKSFIKLENIKVDYFPFPSLVIRVNPIKYLNVQLDTVLTITPFLKGLFSGQWAYCVAQYRITGNDIMATAAIKGVFDPRKNFNSLEQAAQLYTTVGRLEGRGDFKFEDYTGVMRFNYAQEKWFHLLRKKSKVVSSGQSIFQWDSSSSADKVIKRLTANLDLKFESDFFQMLYKFLSKLNISWVSVEAWEKNLQSLTNLLLPFKLNIASNIWVHSKILSHFSHQYQTVTDFYCKTQDAINAFKEFLKICAHLSFKQETAFQIEFTKKAIAKGMLRVEHDTSSKNTSTIRMHLDLDWASLLSYFEIKTPEIYKNFRNLFDPLLSIINKNKTLSHVELDMFTQYDKKLFTISNFTINGLSFPQIMQTYFLNLQKLNSYKNSNPLLNP